VRQQKECLTRTSFSKDAVFSSFPISFFKDAVFSSFPISFFKDVLFSSFPISFSKDVVFSSFPISFSKDVAFPSPIDDIYLFSTLTFTFLFKVLCFRVKFEMDVNYYKLI